MFFCLAIFHINEDCELLVPPEVIYVLFIPQSMETFDVKFVFRAKRSALFDHFVFSQAVSCAEKRSIRPFRVQPSCFVRREAFYSTIPCRAKLFRSKRGVLFDHFVQSQAVSVEERRSIRPFRAEPSYFSSVFKLISLFTVQSPNSYY